MTFADTVKALGFPAGSYAVFGSGPLAVRGIRESRDVDLIVTEALFTELAKDASWTKGELHDHHAFLHKDDIEVFYTWAPGAWNVDQLIKDAEVIDGVPFVRLDAVIEWKQLRNSDKDKEDLSLIEAFKQSHA